MFNPTTLNGQVIKNKIVRSATRDYLFNPDGTVSEEYFQIYEELAKNNVGLIICGYLRIDDNFASSEPQGSCDGDKYISGLKRIADICHHYQSIVYGQISFTGNYKEDEITPSHIDYLVKKYTNAALTLQKAGFDGVQVHMAHGNYLSQLLSSYIENVINIPRQIISSIKEHCGKEFTVITKINADMDEEFLIQSVQSLYDAGMDAVELSGRTFSKKGPSDSLYYLSTAKLLKQRIDLPVILVGGMYSYDTMQQALKAGIDLVSICRPLICEPDFLLKINQDHNYISKCKRCNQCLRSQKTMHRRCIFLKKSPSLKKYFH